MIEITKYIIEDFIKIFTKDAMMIPNKTTLLEVTEIMPSKSNKIFSPSQKKQLEKRGFCYERMNSNSSTEDVRVKDTKLQIKKLLFLSEN